MIRRHLAWLGILVVLPFLGGVQNCNQPADTGTSGEQTPDPGAGGGDAGDTGASGETGGDSGATEGAEGAPGEEGAATEPQVTSEMLAQNMFNEGLLALSMRPPQVPTAIDRFDQVTQLMPEWAEGHYNLGLAYVEGRQPDKAVKSLEQATRLDPALGDAWVALGQAYQRQNRVGAAMDAFNECVRHDESNTECRLGKVRYAFDQGESPESLVRQIKEILTLNSTSVGAYTLLALTYMRQGEYKLAEFALLKAQQANEDAKTDPTVHCNMGMIHRALGEEYEAQVSFERALELDPNHIQTLVNLANIRIANLDYQGAKELVQRAVIQDKNHTGARLALGIAKRGTADLDGAKTEFEYLLNEDPSNHDALYNLAVLYGDHYRDFDKAIASYEELIRITPGLADDDPLHEYLAEVVKARDRELRRIDREKRRQEKEEKRRAEEAAEAEEAAREAAEAAAAAAAAAAEGGGEPAPDGSEGTPEGGEGAPESGEGTPESGEGTETAPPEGGAGEGGGEAPPAADPAAGEGDPAETTESG